MKRLIYTFALFFVSLFAMAWDIADGSYIYFANTKEWQVNKVNFLIGHTTWSQGYEMTKIANTSIYQVKMSSWGGYGQWAVIGVDANWGGEGNSVENRVSWAKEKTAVVKKDAGLNKYSLILQDASFKTNSNDYKSLLNFTHTIKTQLDNSDNANVGDVSTTYYELTAVSTATKKTSSITSTSSGTISVVYTSQVTLKATPATGYTFEGWYEGSTRKSTSTTYTYTAENSTKTVVAKFTKQPTVHFTNTETEVGVGYKFVPTVESANLTNPTYKYTVKYNNGTATSVDASGHVLNQAGKYVFTVTATGTNGSSATATYTINAVNFYVAGTAGLCGSGWNPSDVNNVMTYSDGVFTKIFTDVPNGSHEFKITDGSWNNSWGYGNVFSDYSSSYSASGDNIKFTLDTTATVIISYNNSTDKIELKVVYDNFEVGEKIYFSSDQGASPYAAYLFGESGETWVKLSQEYANIYSATVPNGNWGGVIFCSMKSETLNRTNINSKTKYLEYEGKNWYKWTNESEWRNFENLIYAGQKLYFKPDSNWESANARFAAYYWDVLGENRWANCVYDSVGHAYHVVAPTVGEGVDSVVWTNIKFVRINPKYNENGWNTDDIKDRVWNETPDLVYDGANDFFIVKLTKKDGSVWDWNSADPENWISFSHPFKGAIFFEPNASLKATANKRFSIYLWNGFDENCWVKMQPMATHEDIYCVVIPEGYWTGANICSMNPDNETDGWDKDKMLNQTDNLTYHSDKLLYKAPDKWDNNVPADECWAVLNLPKADDVDCSTDIQAGVYYTYFRRTLSISTPADIAKWHWISLPYDAKIRDIKGGEYGTDFIIQEYNTAERAKWQDNIAANNTSAWREMDAKETLLAGKGYILAVNNEKSSYSLTFVSETDLNVVADQFEGYNTDFSSGVTESANWHLIGTGVYGNAGGYENVNYVAKPDATGADYTYHFLGREPQSNFNPTSLGIGALEPYTAFFVQHTGDYSFTKAAATLNAAPRRARAEEVVEHYYVNIVGVADTSHTAIFLAEDGSDDYVVGKDFLHLGASGESLQFYSKQGKNDLAFNYLKKEERTIALGGYVAEAGKYTISLTADGKASSVILYDSQTGEATDLLQYDYEFDAEKGYLDGRFDITIAYAAQDDTPTDVEIGGNDRLVVLNSDGIVTFEGLAIGEEVVVYDIMGRCVNHFVASNDVANVMLADGVYVMKHSSEIIKFVVNR